MSKAAELAKWGEVSTNGQVSGRRNIVINGAMQVAQRGASTASVTATGYYTCDRMNLEISGLGTHTVTQETLTSGGAFSAGFTKAWRVDCTTADASPAAGDYMVFQQKIEAQNLQQLAFGTSSAKSLTLSFYVKSNKTGTYEIMHFVSDGGRQVNSTYTINSANTWEKKTLLIPADTGGTINTDTGEGWRSLFYLGRGSNRTGGSTPTSWQAYAIADEASSQTVNIADNTANDWAITGYQLEVGSVATPFEHRSFGEELALCQRYYQKITTAAASMGLSSASSYNTAQVNGVIQIVPSMRATPSIDIVTVTNGYRYVAAASNTNFDVLSLEAGSNNSQVLWVKGGLSGLTAGQAGWLQTTSTSSYMAFKSEL